MKESTIEGIPELAGVATYATAARIGYTVEENVQWLSRLHWAERRLMAVMLAHPNSTPVWESEMLPRSINGSRPSSWKAQSGSG